MNAAIIAAAGWTGIGYHAGMAKYPDAFLPLDDGTTPLDRLATQLSRLGYKIYIGLGKRGYPFGAYQAREAHGLVDGELKAIEDVLERFGLHPDDTPWTQEIYDHASQFGTVVEIDSPGYKTRHDTFCTIIDKIGMDRDKLILVRSNTVMSSKLLKGTLTLSWPGQCQPYPEHSIFFLDRQATEIYRSYAEDHRERWRLMAYKNGAVDICPDGNSGTGRLKGIGIAHYGFADTENEWRDIDELNKYLEVRMSIQIGEIDSVVLDEGKKSLGSLDDLSTLTHKEKAILGVSYDPSIYGEEWYLHQGWQHDWCHKLLGWFVGEFGPFKSSLDLGAGDGYYSYVMRQMGSEAVAVELNKGALDVFPDGVIGVAHDLREPLDFSRTYELIICLEVAEHLPEESANTLCDTIARHCGKMLLFTAAPRGQGGHGHCNLQPHGYWQEKLEARGLRFCSDDSQKTKYAWWNILNGSLPWLPGNVYVYRKIGE